MQLRKKKKKIVEMKSHAAMFRLYSLSFSKDMFMLWLFNDICGDCSSSTQDVEGSMELNIPGN